MALKKAGKCYNQAEKLGQSFFTICPDIGLLFLLLKFILRKKHVICVLSQDTVCQIEGGGDRGLTW